MEWTKRGNDLSSRGSTSRLRPCLRVRARATLAGPQRRLAGSRDPRNDDPVLQLRNYYLGKFFRPRTVASTVATERGDSLVFFDRGDVVAMAAYLSARNIPASRLRDVAALAHHRRCFVITSRPAWLERQLRTRSVRRLEAEPSFHTVVEVSCSDQ